MPARSITQTTVNIISVLSILSLFATIWARPSVGLTLGLILFLFILIAISTMTVRKYREAYHLGKIPLSTSYRNICFEIGAVLLAMNLAGLVGKYLSIIVAGEKTGNPAKLITIIGISLIAGWTIGLFVQRACSRLMKIPSGS